MPGHRTSTTTQEPNKEKHSTAKISTQSQNKIDTGANTSDQAQRQQQHDNDYWKSLNTSSDTNNSQQATMSSTTSSRSAASSTRGSSSIDSLKRPLVADHRKSSMERAMDKARSKLSRSHSGAEVLPNDELDFERQRAKAVEKQRRKEEYERLGLGDKTKYGMGGMSMNG